MRFQEAKHGGEKRRFAQPGPQLLSPDSGQVEEPLRPAIVAKRCDKRSEGERHWIIWYPKVHSLECARAG